MSQNAQRQQVRARADAGPSSLQMQPVIGTDRSRPIPSLRGVEQPGGPDVDGPLILPDDQVWSSRISELVIDLEADGA